MPVVSSIVAPGRSQPLPRHLVTKLQAKSRRLYESSPLLQLPRHPARTLEIDLKLAGIPKWTSDGKVDFHSLRKTYTTLIIGIGANAKEAQELARHANPNLTINTYAEARRDRLAHLTNTLGKLLE